MFEKFHPDAREAIVRSKEEALRLGQPEIGTEHLLLALLTGRGLAAEALAAAGVEAEDLRARLPLGGATTADPLDADALASIGIDLDAVRRASDAAFGPGSLDRNPGRRRRRGGVGSPRMARSHKQAIELALRSAVRLDQRHISSGHLLLGVLDQPANPAVAVLTDAGVDIPRLREDIARRMTAAA
jgi:ATP-dependent Clp protease ATP-binding subunit ClpA